MGEDLIVKRANRAFRERFKIARADLENARIHHLGDGWKMPKLRTWLTEMMRKVQPTAELQLEHKFPSLGLRKLNFCAQRLKADSDDVIVLIISEAGALTKDK